MSAAPFGIDQRTELRSEPRPGDLLVVTITDHLTAVADARADERQQVLSMRFTEFMAAIKKSCPCICHEYTRDINPHDGKCVCNGGAGMETL